MDLIIAIAAVAVLVVPFTLEQDGVNPPLPLGLFRFINPPPQGPPVLAAITFPTLSAVNVIVSLDVVRSSHDTTVVEDYSRRGCIGSVFNAPLGCPCADPGKRCYDPLSQCNLENRCVCDGRLGFRSADTTRCIAYATTTRSTTRTTTTPVATTSTTTRTSTTTTTTITSTQTSTTTKAPFVRADPACSTQNVAVQPSTIPPVDVNICTTPSLTLTNNGPNNYVTLFVPNPMPKTPCTTTINQGGLNLKVIVNEMSFPAGGSGCSTGAFQYSTKPEYCATSCPSEQFVPFPGGTSIDQITFRVDAAAAATVDPAVTPFFLKMQINAT